LQNYDCVISPSDDGGYCLLGLRKLNKTLFENITWSTSTVYRETLKRIRSITKNYKILTSLNDIDTEEELMNWLNNKQKGNKELKKLLAIYSQI
jgi:glycosyltransferase A (GT-A) superfamily protein (DUF2064 family)